MSKSIRVAIVGAGPAGFYTADHLLKNPDIDVSVDLYDMLPTPFGLVRAGVAPDHEKIKNVTAKFAATAARPGFRFFGNVEIGKDLTVPDLRAHYHLIVYTTGAQIDRSLGIPGEDLSGSHSATEFVAWYNGHPDFRDRTFDLSQSAVAIVGVGNVAVDVARILARPTEDLKTTDIADYALAALERSNIRTIYVLGRRGPAQAAFTNPEAKELGELTDVSILVKPEESALDPITLEELEANPDRLTQKKVDMIQAFAANPTTDRPRSIHLRFLVSPEEILGEDGRVVGLRIVRNELTKDGTGRVRPRPTGETEILPVGLVFRSVGYRGTPVPDVPFNESWGVIANEDGRVVQSDGSVVTGEYTAGWIKRGPSGVIGTNKSDALATVESILEDIGANSMLSPTAPDPSSIENLLAARGVKWFDWIKWERLNELETSAGESCGRPRVKFTTREEMLRAVSP